MNQLVDQRILQEARRITVQEGVLAVLLAGSYARGEATPYSDVDLLVITAGGPPRIEVTLVEGWTGFDRRFTTLADLEQEITNSFITCNCMLHLLPLTGDPGWKQRIEALAQKSYSLYVPQADGLGTLQRQVGAAARSVAAAPTICAPVAQAQAVAGLAWLAGRTCLGMAGIGPVREDQWCDALRAAALPFDAATPLAQWQLGRGLEERLDAAWTLAERVVGESLPRTSVDDRPQAPPPAFETRALPDAAEAAAMHHMVQTVGFVDTLPDKSGRFSG